MAGSIGAGSRFRAPWAGPRVVVYRKGPSERSIPMMSIDAEGFLDRR